MPEFARRLVKAGPEDERSPDIGQMISVPSVTAGDAWRTGGGASNNEVHVSVGEEPEVTELNLTRVGDAGTDVLVVL
jgi:hypothetical protein